MCIRDRYYPDFKGLPIIDIETPSKKSFLNEIINRMSIDSLLFVPEYTNSLKLMSLVRWKYFLKVLSSLDWS